MTIAILNFETSEVIIKKLPKKFNANTDSEKIEEWMENQGYSTSSCQWMYSKELKVVYE